MQPIVFISRLNFLLDKIAYYLGFEIDLFFFYLNTLPEFLKCVITSNRPRVCSRCKLIFSLQECLEPSL